MLYTIGHSNHKPEVVRDFLKERGITHLFDVRSKPYSRFNYGFNRERFHETLADVGIAYHHWGDALGGFNIPDAEMATNIDRLVANVSKRPTAKAVTMCSEGPACECHRHHWITRYILKNTDLKVTNIHPTQPDEDAANVPFVDNFNPSGQGLPWPLVRPWQVVGTGLPRHLTVLRYETEDVAKRAVKRACPGHVGKVEIVRLKV